MSERGITRAEWLDFDGIEHCVQCCGCGVWTVCNHGWCWSCDGNMRVVDGLLFDRDHENAALRAQVERLREVVKSAKSEFGNIDCNGLVTPYTRKVVAKLAAVLRETDVDNETGRE